MTFSILGRCAATGMFGVAVSSSSPAVAARCAHARAGVGAVATQNVTDPRLGPAALDLMERGASAAQALDILCHSRLHMAWRQLTLIDRDGATAAHSGAKTLGLHGIEQGASTVAGGTILATPRVLAAMRDSYVSTQGHIGHRLLTAMEAGRDAGGEEGPVRSAGLIVVHREAWPLVDLRVDWDETCPIAALRRLWRLWEPQADAYVTRALAPDAAPTFGVPGDL